MLLLPPNETLQVHTTSTYQQNPRPTCTPSLSFQTIETLTPIPHFKLRHKHQDTNQPCTTNPTPHQADSNRARHIDDDFPSTAFQIPKRPRARAFIKLSFQNSSFQLPNFQPATSKARSYSFSFWHFSKISPQHFTEPNPGAPRYCFQNRIAPGPRALVGVSLQTARKQLLARTNDARPVDDTHGPCVAARTNTPEFQDGRRELSFDKPRGPREWYAGGNRESHRWRSMAVHHASLSGQVQ